MLTDLTSHYAFVAPYVEYSGVLEDILGYECKSWVAVDGAFGVVSKTQDDISNDDRINRDVCKDRPVIVPIDWRPST